MKLKLIKISTLICLVSLSLGVLAVKAEERRPVMGQLKEKAENQLQKNREVRNVNLDDKRNLQASTSMMGKYFRASSTMMFRNLKDQRQEIMKKMKINTFDIRKNALVKELTMSLNNLNDMRARTVAFITKAETSGRDMTKAKAQLVIADEKIAKAKIAVDALNAFQYSVPNTASTTAEINLDKPRKIGDDAIKAVKEARDALKQVVGAISEFMGKGDENRNKDESREKNENKNEDKNDNKSATSTN